MDKQDKQMILAAKWNGKEWELPGSGQDKIKGSSLLRLAQKVEESQTKEEKSNA